MHNIYQEIIVSLFYYQFDSNNYKIEFNFTNNSLIKLYE